MVSKTRTIIMFLSEFLGTAILMGLGCLSLLSTTGSQRTHLEIAVAFGLVIMICIHVCGPFSGGHLNPWLSLAEFILGKMSWKLMFVYMAGQISGGLFGYSTLWLLVPTEYFFAGEGLCLAGSKEEIVQWQIVYGEFLATGVLVFAFCGTVDSRAALRREAISVRFGFIVMGLICAEGYYTGASMNLARSLPPIVWHGGWKELPFYICGQATSTVIIALMWRYLFASPSEITEENIQGEAN